MIYQRVIGAVLFSTTYMAVINNLSLLNLLQLLEMASEEDVTVFGKCSHSF
jgi:hypothetical protein